MQPFLLMGDIQTIPYKSSVDFLPFCYSHSSMDYQESNVLPQIRELQCAIDEFTIRDYDDDNYANNDDNDQDRNDNSNGDNAQEIKSITSGKEEEELYAEKVQLEDVDLKLRLPNDDDFASLMDQLNAIEILPTTDFEPVAENESSQEVVQPIPFSPSSSPPALPQTPLSDITQTPPTLADTPIFPCPETPRRSRSSNTSSYRTRRTSISSKRSCRSLRSIKRVQEKPQAKQQYHARTYAEMMRIPMLNERIAFYKKTFDLCMQADSQLSSWINRQKAKGLPKPMTEGSHDEQIKNKSKRAVLKRYRPPPRPAPSPDQPRRDECKMTPSLSGSISMFLRKSVSTTFGNLRGYADTPKPVPNRLYSASRLSLARRGSRYPLRVTPLTKDRPPPIPSRFNKTLPCPKEDALSEICSILPHIDRRVLSGYLNEAGGDSMTAITLAVSQLRKSAPPEKRP
ncbi:hypothetical protein EC973_001929 [Apophysomyces ossiformis]|uniref:Uncharacterized protein n=1 Tax=Apophysomyces ossiformis TaxID=679940 RepID=A0A8H7EV43_9FUNG|nr:hypothetical protein EC973_001929 [Apophysomyces ossiformis]